MNKLAASVQFWAEPEIIAAVPKEDFSPRPKVNSVIVGLKTRIAEHATKESGDNYYRAVRALFRQPRKTILNNLFAAAADFLGDANERKPSRDVISKKLTAALINPGDRPANLGREKILKISRAFFE